MGWKKAVSLDQGNLQKFLKTQQEAHLWYAALLFPRNYCFLISFMPSSNDDPGQCALFLSSHHERPEMS